jgi:hypothetical protein
VPAATMCLLIGGCEQRRLPDAGLSLQKEYAGPLQARLEEFLDRVQFGAPADDGFRRSDRHRLDLGMWRL